MKNNKTIMIIDDTWDIRESLRDIFEYEGYKVLTAANGIQALDMLATKDKPGLIFLDVFMPVMDGQKFLEILRSIDDLALIPVIAMSANASPYEVRGADHFVKKPFDIDMLCGIAEEFFSTKANLS